YRAGGSGGARVHARRGGSDRYLGPPKRGVTRRPPADRFPLPRRWTVLGSLIDPPAERRPRPSRVSPGNADPLAARRAGVRQERLDGQRRRRTVGQTEVRPVRIIAHAY